MAPITLKLTFGGELHRTSSPEFSFEAIHTTSAEVFRSELGGRSFELKYRDDDDDLCTLTSVTFSDFEFLNKGNKMVRLDVIPTPAPAANCNEVKEAVAAGAAANGQQRQHAGEHFIRAGMPPLFSSFFQDLFVAGSPEDALPGLLVHFAPILAQQLSGHQESIDRHVAEKKEVLLPAVQALREDMEPFPVFQETQVALDRIVQGDSMQGLGAALVLFFQTFCKLPQDEQHCVSLVIVSNVTEKVGCVMPALFPSLDCSPGAAEPPMHIRIQCDGCGLTPIIGPRFKCTSCLDYDLCGACYARRGEMHPGQHTFECLANIKQPFKGWGKGWWWKAKGKGKGEGKGKGKSKGKHNHLWRAVSSESDTSSASTDSSLSDSGCDMPVGVFERTAGIEAWREAKGQRIAKKNFKNATKEAKQRLKKEVKAARKVWKEQVKAWKEQKKTWKDQKMAWKKQKNTWKEQRRSDWSAQASTATEGVTMEGVEAASSSGESTKSPMQVLADMGFNNQELNAQLLACYENNVRAVLDVLAGGW